MDGMDKVDGMDGWVERKDRVKQAERTDNFTGKNFYQ